MMPIISSASASYNIQRNGPAGDQNYPEKHPSQGPGSCPSLPSDRSYAMLQGHIKLIAMVPNIPPEKHVQPTPTASRHSLPPITPRLMPSITQKYGNPPQQHGYLPPLVEQQQRSPSHVQFPTMWMPNAPLHPSQTFVDGHAAANMASGMTFSQQMPYLSNNQVPWHHQQLAYQYVHSQAPAHFQNYPFVYPSSYQPYPQSKNQFQMADTSLPYAVQSSPCVLSGSDCHAYGYQNHFQEVPSQLPQQCTSLPFLSRKIKKKTSKKSTGAGVEEKVYIVVEDKVASSSSSSHTCISSDNNPQHSERSSTALIMKDNPFPCIDQFDQESQPLQGDEAPSVHELFQNSEECSKAIRCTTAVIVPAQETVAIEVENELPPTPIKTHGNRPKRKDTSVMVSVADCFMSDSSEIDQDPTEHNHHMKRKPELVKSPKTSKAPTTTTAPTKIFTDLDLKLNSDEHRLYTSDYIVELLSSENWNECHESLNIVVRLARHNPQRLLEHMSTNNVILWCTLNHITSKKSALCRAALMTFTELFAKIPGALDNHLEKITDKLIVKSLAPNQFIRAECEKALMAMVAHGNHIKILSALETVRRKSTVRAAGLKTALARIALQIVKVAGVDSCVMNELYAEKLIPMLFCFMTEPDSAIRMTAKEALGMLMNHLQFDAVVLKYVSFDRNSSEVFKKLDKMRGRCRKRRGITKHRNRRL